MLKLTFEDLRPHQLINNKIINSKANFDGNIVVTLTTQGSRAYNGINISFHIAEFTVFP